MEQKLREEEVLNNKGTSLVQDNKPKLAVPFFRRAIGLDPDNLSFRTNLGIALSKLPGYEEEAKSILHNVLEKDPTNCITLHALGVLADYNQAYEDSFACYRDCKKLSGDQSITYGYDFDVATSLIRAGKWEEGWKAYECRRQWKPEKTFKDLPTWDGTRGKKVYVWAEQGLGDMLQFSRYVPWVVERSEAVLFAVPAAMFELFQGFTKICDLAPSELNPPRNADYEIPLMSLPTLVGNDIPKDPGLIQGEPNKHLFGIDPCKLNIGLCWAASRLAVRNFNRRIPLEELIQLAGDHRRQFYSLQGDSRVNEIFELGIQKLIFDTTSRIEGDWCVTRDLIRAMDYVVTVDTSVAHLAGIMNKPTFMFVDNIDSWRWSYDWYPSVKVIRRSQRETWEPEIRLVDQLLDGIDIPTN